MKIRVKSEIPKCNIHPNYEINLLRFHKDINQVLSCSCCIEEQDEINGISSICYQKILDSTEKSYFINWPPFEKDNSQIIKKQLQNTFSQIQQLQYEQANDIRVYFKALRTQIESKIQAIEQKYLTLLKNQLQSEYNLVKEYNTISKRFEIQSIIRQESKSVHQKNLELKRMADEMMDNKKEYTQKLLKIAKKVEEEKKINIDKLDKVKNQIIGNLDLFYRYVSDQYNIIDDEQQQTNFQNLSLILRNQFNQCNISFIDSLEQAITSNFYLFKDIFNQEVFIEDKIQIQHDKLSNSQVTDILKLTQKISQLHQEFSIKSELTYKTKKIFDSYLNKISQQQYISNLLVRYPIFELIPEIKDIKQVKVALQRSNYNQGADQFMIFCQDTLYPSIDYTSIQLQAYCDFKLNNQLKYIFKVEVSNNQNRKNLQFGFGLGRDSLVNHNIYEQGLMYFSDGNWGIDQIVKGDNLASHDVSSNINEFLVKICLQDNIIEVSDLPLQNNVIALSKQNYSKISNDLRFFISFPSKYIRGDWIKVSQIEIVDSFYQ